MVHEGKRRPWRPWVGHPGPEPRVGLRPGMALAMALAALMAAMPCRGGIPAAALVPPSVTVSTFAGIPVSIAEPDGLFLAPGAVAVDTAGNLYVADTGHHTILKITAAGVVAPLAGTAGLMGSADGLGTAALFNGPNGLGVDGAGNVYVADSGNSTIRKITPEGAVTTLAGAAGQPGHSDGKGAAARFYWPFGIAVTGSGTVYVGEPVNDIIRKITPDGVVTTLAGQVLSDGNLTGEAQATPSIDGQGTAATFDFPHGLALDAAGNLLVADTGNNLIRKVSPDGIVSTVAGLTLVRGHADGSTATATLFHPTALTVDGSGTIYVADTLNEAIRRITPAGAVTTLAGTAWQPGSADGTGAGATFNHPSGIAVDPSGNLFVADTLNDTIRKITF